MKTRGQQGYAMAALLVALSIMAVMMTVAMPVWHQMTQREREAELIFRGQQYARAIGLFQRRSGPGVLPPNLDVLVDQHFLRKKFKDPVTGKDFDLLRPTSPNVTETGGRGPGGRSSSQLSGSQGTGTVGSSSAAVVGGAAGGIMGVASKSTAESIRIYNGRTHYNEWQFVYVAQTQTPGAGLDGGRGNGPAGPGGNGPGGPRGNGNGPRGNPPNQGGPFPPGGRGAGAGQPGRGAVAPVPPLPGGMPRGR
jgi:type II secretory pathway pseudopilin PulG